MAMELVKDSILLNNKAQNASTQLILEGDIIVPDSKPDIANILRVNGTVVIDEQSVQDERISFQGTLKLSILYQAKKSENLIHSMTGTINFEDFIRVDGLKEDSVIHLTAVIDHLEYRLINDRKLNIKAVVNVTAQVYNETANEIILDVTDLPNIQLEKGEITVCNTVENKKDRFDVKEEVFLPAGLPNIRDLLESDVSLSNVEIKANDGKVSVKGILNLSVLYIGDTDESLIEAFDTEIPFHGYIDAKNAADAMMADAVLTVENQEITITEDSDGEPRGLEADITIGADFRVTDNETIEMVEDAYCLNETLNLNKETMHYPQFINRSQAKGSVKETISFDGKYPDAMQVLKVWANIVIDDTELVTDKIIVEGVIHCDILYIAANDSSPVNVVSKDIPFRQEVEVRGAKKGMQTDVWANIEDVSFNMLSEREVEIRVTLAIDAIVTKMIDTTVITDIVLGEKTEDAFQNIASAVIYVVQKGDSLWKIAKKYNTTIENILLVNEIENPEKIYPGQKLLILKRVYE